MNGIEREIQMNRVRTVLPSVVSRVVQGRAKNPCEALEQLDLDLGPSVRADAELMIEKVVERCEDHPDYTDESDGGAT